MPLIPAVLCVYKHLASFVRSSSTLMKTQDWVETSVHFLTTTSVQRFRLVEFPYWSLADNFTIISKYSGSTQ